MKKTFFISVFCSLLFISASASEWDSVSVILNRIVEPVFPDTNFYITDYGAVGDGSTICTEAFRKAIDSCSAAGGGKVNVDNGVFLTGPIHLKSNVNLHISPTAKIVFSGDAEQYKPYVYTRYAGVEYMGYSPLIYAYEQENIAITGGGTLDGLGKEWDSWFSQAAGDFQTIQQWADDNIPVKERIFENGSKLRPSMIQPYRCKNVFIDSINVREGPFWHLHPVLCTNVKITNTSVIGHWHNNDGCNPESCKDVLIRNCYFDTGDDCIAIKSGRNADGRRVNVPTENVVIQNCTMKDGHGGVVIGSETTGGARYIFAENCFMDSPDLWYILRIKTNSYRGSHVHHVFIRNIEAQTVGRSMLRINYNYGEGAGGDFQPDVHNIYLENINVKNTVDRPIWIDCYDNNPSRDIFIKNCHLKAKTDVSILNHVKNLYLDSSSVNGLPILFREHNDNVMEAEYYTFARNIAFSNYKYKKSGYGYIEAKDNDLKIEWETNSDRFFGNSLFLFFLNPYKDSLAMDFSVNNLKYPLTFAPSYGSDWDTLHLKLTNTQEISNLCLESKDSVAGFLLDRIEAFETFDTGTTHLSTNVNEEILVYPNPTLDEIFIQGLQTEQAYKILIYSLDGMLLKNIHSYSGLSQPIKISTSNFDRGTYILSIENEAGIIARSLIILKD